jgi:hypothetical protein
MIAGIACLVAAALVLRIGRTKRRDPVLAAA